MFTCLAAWSLSVGNTPAPAALQPLTCCTQQHRLQGIREIKTLRCKMLSWVLSLETLILRPKSTHEYNCICFQLQSEKMCCAGGGLPVPLPVKTCGAGTHFIFQHISLLATKKKEFTAGQVHNQTMPALSPNSSSPHPDIWFDSGWARFTFYNNNRTWGKVFMPLWAARGLDHCSIRCLFSTLLSLLWLL